MRVIPRRIKLLLIFICTAIEFASVVSRGITNFVNHLLIESFTGVCVVTVAHTLPGLFSYARSLDVTRLLNETSLSHQTRIQIANQNVQEFLYSKNCCLRDARADMPGCNAGAYLIFTIVIDCCRCAWHSQQRHARTLCMRRVLSRSWTTTRTEHSSPSLTPELQIESR